MSTRLPMPLTADHVHKLSLAAHLALAVYRSGSGNRNQLYTLIRATYLSYFLWQAGYGDSTHDFYCEVEGELNNLAKRAELNDDSYMSDAAFEAMSSVMCVYDEQISSVSVEKFVDCQSRLDRLIRIQIPQQVEKIEATGAA
jgi:hypothetical protein